MQRIYYILRILVFLSVGFCSLSLADISLHGPVYCNDGACLYCDSHYNCVIVSRAQRQKEYSSSKNVNHRDQSPVFKLSQAINGPLSFVYYRPTIDVAQYALHEGDVRSANLIEGFIPLYQHAPNTLSFTDIRFYNPNGTPTFVLPKYNSIRV